MNFNEYLQTLDNDKDLKIIEARVSPDLELAALCRHEFSAESGGSALWFNSIQGSSFPAVANLFGSEMRTARALHSNSFDHFTAKLNHWLRQRKGPAEERFLNTGEDLAVKNDPGAVLESTALTKLPAIKSWPDEGGRYLTLALSLTQHPETGERNLGLYRAQVIDNGSLALNFSSQSGAGLHYEAAKRLGKPLPVCLLLGVDPALIWVAAAPLPRGCDELTFYQSFFGQTIQWLAAVTQPLKIPQGTEVVIEGHILANQTTVEGPYGNHTGLYVTRADCPLVRVTSVRHKPQPVVPLTVVGPPPSENVHLGRANEILIRAMIKIDFPQVEDVWMPEETMFHGAAVVAVRPRTQAENQNLIETLWQRGPLSQSRFLVLVDASTHTRSLSNSWWRLVNGLKNPRIYTAEGRTAIDATQIETGVLVQEDVQLPFFVPQPHDETRL